MSAHEQTVGPSAPEQTAVQSVRLAAPSLLGLLRIVLVVVVCTIALYLVWRIRVVVRLAAISLFLALAINPIVDAADRRTRVPRALIILAIYVLLTAAVAIVGAVVVPSMAKEIGDLSRNAPHYARDLRADSTFRHYDNRYHITTKLVTDARRLPQALAQLAGPIEDVTVQAFGFVGQLVTVLALTFLLILHGRSYVTMALSLTGARKDRNRALIIEVNRAVANYMLGNIAISALATIATWIVLSILGVPYALSLGFVVGFFDLIPLVGATIGAIVVALATVTVSFPVATLVWIGFIVVWQRFEDYVVQPAVYGRALNVNPIVTIISVLAGAELLGVLGALLAIPTAAVIQILAREWWSTRNGAHTEQPPAAASPPLQRAAQASAEAPAR
ncbi:MAG TPA: AI-2E family transporter [Solirubrobacteraceae bacterium]|nr:AI-2E family transporter [Solirubrobacteraceae bacterium]